MRRFGVASSEDVLFRVYLERDARDAFAKISTTINSSCTIAIATV